VDKTCNKHGTEEKCIKILIRKPERKRPLGRSRRRCEGNIKMELSEIGWVVTGWIHLAQDRDKWRVSMNNFRVT
jgi:hypothetical protein